MAGDLNDNFDAMQILKRVYEQPHVPDAQDPKLLRVRNIGGNLVPDIYDEVSITYNVGGPADQEIATVAYLLDSNLLAVLILTYDINGLLTDVKRV